LKHQVAVYGSLRRNQSNHGLLTRFNANFRGTTILVGWHMLGLGPYPAIIPSKSAKEKIEVEVYEVSQTCLSALDHLEGVDAEHYERIEITGSYGRMWIYQWHPRSLLDYMERNDMLPMVLSGVWAHGAKVVEFEQGATERLLAKNYLKRMEDIVYEEVELNPEDFGEMDEEDIEIMDELDWEEVDGDVLPLPPPAPAYDEVDYPTPIVEDTSYAAVSNPAF
jgi:gamma-glutamylcyclotransferase (GGCT)/AIG2-like uncharacterized protein YtfP